VLVFREHEGPAGQLGKATPQMLAKTRIIFRKVLRGKNFDNPFVIWKAPGFKKKDLIPGRIGPGCGAYQEDRICRSQHVGGSSRLERGASQLI
jgi:hypothetical protein